MKTITRNKRPDELPFTFEQIAVYGARINVWSSKETNQRLIDKWVIEGAYIRTSPDNRIELTVTEEVFTEHEQSIIDAFRVGKIVQATLNTETNAAWCDYSLPEYEKTKGKSSNWPSLFSRFPRWRIKPEEWVPTPEQQAIIDHGLKHGEGSLQMKRKDGSWITFSFSKEGSMRFWGNSFRNYEIRIKPPAVALGEGWRFLKPGEMIQDGDEWRNDGTPEWVKTSDAGCILYNDRNERYRRRIEKPTLRLMRPDEFPAVWWVLITANRRKEEIQSWCLVTEVNSKYFCYRERGILDWLYVDKTCIWSPDRKEEKSFFVEDVK